MPEISRFLGIVVTMYYGEHGRPHFHARAGAFRISVEVDSGIVRGTFPRELLRHVLDWSEVHRDDLFVNWRHARLGEPLEPIPPLE